MALEFKDSSTWEVIAQEPDLDLLLGRFSAHVRVSRPISSGTVEAYMLDVTTLGKWAAANDKSVIDLSAAELSQYAKERLASGASPATVSRHLSSYRQFYAYLVSAGAVERNPTDGLRRPKLGPRRRRLLSDDVIEAVLQPSVLRPWSSAAEYRAERDHTIVCLLCGTSLPISSIRLLQWRQIDWSWGVIKCSTRQQGERRYVLSAALLEALGALRKHAEATLVDSDPKYCFTTATELPMTRQGFCQRIRKWGADIGLDEPLTPSALRRTGLDRAAKPI